MANPLDWVRALFMLTYDAAKDRWTVADFCRAVFIFALLWSLTGCAGLTGVRLGSYVDDANLNAAVAQRFAAEQTSDFARVKTEVKDGVIYLSGTVASDEQVRRAEKVAFQVAGTKGVVNNLKVEKP